jgi:glycerol-3-phosphate acyltransferase PlsY
MQLSQLFLLLTAYLTGSIPTAVWTGKLWFGTDVRLHGSGNAGATNTFRVLGKKAGTFVLLFDVFKGWAGSSLSLLLLGNGLVTEENLLFWKLVFGLITVLGHVYPVFAGFKGGKGVASLLGMVLCISWQAGLICLGCFLVLFLIWHYVSLGSMAGGLIFCGLMASGFCGPADTPAITLSVLMAAMVIYTHRGNIHKLLNGNENKMYLIKPKSPQ